MSGETGVTIAASYVAANKFSVAGNRVDEFYRGLRCRCDLGAAGAVTVTATASAYTGGVTVVTVREYTLAETLTAVGHTPGLPAGSLPAHGWEHGAGGYDPISHTALADVGEKTHAEIDAYLADVSAALSGEAAARQALAADFLAHEGAANPHSGSASTVALNALNAAVAQALADEAADRAAGDDEAATARALLTPMARMLNASFPLRIDSNDGATLEGDRIFTLVMATVAELLAYGTTLSGKVVTDTVLAAACKLLITTNTTINVATTGSDTTGDGTASAPFASIAKALSSIAGKLIASGVTVTIQVADGTYTVSSTIVIDHPDADKIQILGNTTAETTVAIAAIDTTAKTITVAGDYTGSIQAGDYIGLVGSSTSGLNGAYVVSGRTYTGGNTVITCATETFASATVGGGSIVIKPCNRCSLVFSANISGFYISKSLRKLQGFIVSGSGSGTQGVVSTNGSKVSIYNCISKSFYHGFVATDGACVGIYLSIGKSNTSAIVSQATSTVTVNSTFIADTQNVAFTALYLAIVRAISSRIITRSCTTLYSPGGASPDVIGNSNAIVSST